MTETRSSDAPGSRSENSSRSELIQALRDELQEELKSRIARRSAAGTAIRGPKRSHLQAVRSLQSCQEASLQVGSDVPLDAVPRSVVGSAGGLCPNTSQSAGALAAHDHRSVLPAVRQSSYPVFETGVEAWDRALPDGGIPCGAVTEIRVSGAGMATTLALRLCGNIHRRAEAGMRSGLGREHWCAFVDPRATLFAPGAPAYGVHLERLLVLRPAPRDVVKAAILLTEARALSLIVIDLRELTPDSTPHRSGVGARTKWTEQSFQHTWMRAIRRISMAIRQVKSSVVLLTQQPSNHCTPRHCLGQFPVALRLEVSSTSSAVRVQISKERMGRIFSEPVSLPVSVLRSA